MQPLSGNQRPDLLTSLMNMSLVLRLPWKMHLCRSSLNVPRLPSFLEMLQNLHVLLIFDKVHNPLRFPREKTSERTKVVQTCCVFNILTSTCASHHNGVHFFDVSTSKSAPRMVVFFATSLCEVLVFDRLLLRRLPRRRLQPSFTYTHTHTFLSETTLSHTCSETSLRISVVECIARAKAIQ